MRRNSPNNKQLKLFIFGVRVRSKKKAISKRRLVQALAITLGYALFASIVIEIQEAVGFDPTKTSEHGAATLDQEATTQALAEAVARAKSTDATVADATGTQDVAQAPQTPAQDTSGWDFDEPAAVDRQPASKSDHLTQVAAASSSAHEEKKGLEPEKALRKLKEGNLRFTSGKVRKAQDGASGEDRRRLAKGQSPHTIIVSCSDSRVSPEFVFDQRLGDIFVVRSAGESLDSSVIASIEYAASHLGTQLILVMGHDRCGAVQATLDTKPGQSAGSPSLDALVADIRPRISERMRQPASAGIELESKANARGVARDLIQRSQILKKRVEEGKLEIRSALYHLETGTVDFD